MPLMSSPIDGSPMREIERYGVKIDICQTSGGIWLDKGELEKIIMAIREEALQEVSAQAEEGYVDWEGDDHTHHHEHHVDERRPRRRKRESLFESLMDIFD